MSADKKLKLNVLEKLGPLTHVVSAFSRANFYVSAFICFYLRLTGRL